MTPIIIIEVFIKLCWNGCEQGYKFDKMNAAEGNTYKSWRKMTSPSVASAREHKQLCCIALLRKYDRKWTAWKHLILNQKKRSMTRILIVCQRHCWCRKGNTAIQVWARSAWIGVGGFAVQTRSCICNTDWQINILFSLIHDRGSFSLFVLPHCLIMVFTVQPTIPWLVLPSAV